MDVIMKKNPFTRKAIRPFEKKKKRGKVLNVKIWHNPRSLHVSARLLSHLFELHFHFPFNALFILNVFTFP